MFQRPIDAVLSILLLIAAGVCEVGGGWCIWKWRREGWHWGFLILGTVFLMASGILPTMQKQNFSRTYAVYGGLFIAISFLWGWAWDGLVPDVWDGVGALITIAGVAIVMFAPRSASSNHG